MERNNRLVFSMKVAKALCERGFKVADVKPNYHDLTKKVWFFYPAEGLEEAIAELTKK